MAKSTKKSMTRTKQPGVYKLETGTYLARIRTKYGSTSQSFTSVTNAKHWLHETKTGLESGKLVIVNGKLMTAKAAARAEGRSVAEVVTAFASVAKCKPKHLEKITAHLGHIAVAEVTRADVVNLLDAECAGMAPSTRNQYLSAISMMFKYALERSWCDHNPAALVSRLSEAGNQRDRVITPREEQQLQALFDQHGQLGTIFALLMGTGARVSEICNLRWRHVDLSAKTLRLSADSTKTKQARTLHVAGKGLERLQEHAKVRPISEDAYVFPRMDGRAPVDGSKVFRPVQTEPLSWWHPHLCRHTWATRVSALPGMNVQQLCLLAGWSSWQMAERYFHLMDNRSADLMNQLAERYS